MAIYSLGERKVAFRGEEWFIADNATVIGTVVLHDQASVWYNAVVRGDSDIITIGERTNIQDAAVLHADPGVPLTLGKNVSVGHQAMLHDRRRHAHRNRSDHHEPRRHRQRLPRRRRRAHPRGQDLPRRRARCRLPRQDRARAEAGGKGRTAKKRRHLRPALEALPREAEAAGIRASLARSNQQWYATKHETDFSR